MPNPNHDEHGRFSSGEGQSGAPVVHDPHAAYYRDLAQTATDPKDRQYAQAIVATRDAHAREQQAAVDELHRTGNMDQYHQRLAAATVAYDQSISAARGALHGPGSLIPTSAGQMDRHYSRAEVVANRRASGTPTGVNRRDNTARPTAREVRVANAARGGGNGSPIPGKTPLGDPLRRKRG